MKTMFVAFKAMPPRLVKTTDAGNGYISSMFLTTSRPCSVYSWTRLATRSRTWRSLLKRIYIIKHRTV